MPDSFAAPTSELDDALHSWQEICISSALFSWPLPSSSAYSPSVLYHSQSQNLRSSCLYKMMTPTTVAPSLSHSHYPISLKACAQLKKLKNSHPPPKSPLLPLLKQTSNSLLTSEVPRREQSLSCSYYITQWHVNSPRSSNLNDQQTIFGHNSLKDSNKLNNSDMSSTGHFC